MCCVAHPAQEITLPTVNSNFADNKKALPIANFLVTKDKTKSKDDVKDEKVTKASFKATEANTAAETKKTKKTEEADELKSEKATKANSKATRAKMTERERVGLLCQQ